MFSEDTLPITPPSTPEEVKVTLFPDPALIQSGKSRQPLWQDLFQRYEDPVPTPTPYDEDDIKVIKKIVEIKLKSNLKKCFNRRLECKFLEHPKFAYYDQLARDEVSKLRKYLSDTLIEIYIRHRNPLPKKKSLFKVVEIDNRSNLKALLIEKLGRKNKNLDCTHINKEIFQEWKRLQKKIKREYITLYARQIYTTA